MLLPAGEYTLEYSRGPEYLIGQSTFQVSTNRCLAPIDLGRVGCYIVGMVMSFRITQGVTDYAASIAFRTIRPK